MYGRSTAAPQLAQAQNESQFRRSG